MLIFFYYSELFAKSEQSKADLLNCKIESSHDSQYSELDNAINLGY